MGDSKERNAGIAFAMTGFPTVHSFLQTDWTVQLFRKRVRDNSLNNSTFKFDFNVYYITTTGESQTHFHGS